MRSWLRIVVLLTVGVWGTVAISAQPSTAVNRSTQIPAATDNMTPYRTLAADTLAAFKAHDMTTARKKAKELESAWDKNEKALQKTSAAVWTQIDKAMDDFIKPLATKAPDATKVQAAYDTFIAKLQLAVKGDGTPIDVRVLR